MAKDQSSKSLARTSYYEKISKATFGSLRRISNRPKSTNTPTPLVSPTHTPETPPAVTLQQPVLIEIESFPNPPPQKPSKKFVRFSSSIKKTGDNDGKELTGQKTFSEESYNGYIDSTKMKMRAPSNVSGARTLSRRESFNDMFSSYISRTKFRLRTTSTLGTDHGKTASSKP